MSEQTTKKTIVNMDDLSRKTFIVCRQAQIKLSDGIRFVQLDNILDIRKHEVTDVFKSVSHYIEFLDGGEVHFSYNHEGNILDFIVSHVGVKFEPTRIVLKSKSRLLEEEEMQFEVIVEGSNEQAFILTEPKKLEQGFWQRLLKFRNKASQ